MSLLPWQLATEFTGWATHLLRLEGGQHQLDALEPGQDIFQRVVVALSAEPFFLDGSEWWQGAENVVNIPMARGENEHLGFHSMDSLA